MNATINENGLAIFEGFFSNEYCDHLIKVFEWSNKNSYTWGRGDQPETKMSDTAITIQYSIDFLGKDIAEFNSVFWDIIYPEYTKYFSILNDIGKHGILTYKIQKTLPGQGYHVWHCEHDSRERAHRLSAYILYLNDIEEGGETEFLYLKKRIYPKKGTLVIFPSGYVHTHRGNPPLSGEKYIMTGWLEYV